MSVLKRVIPCLDVDKGRVVKGTNFVGLRDAGDPVELAERYDAEGADELVFLDITASHEAARHDRPAGAPHGRQRLHPAHDRRRHPLARGRPGGARRGRRQGVGQLGRGARPELIGELADTFGAQCVVLAIDAKRVASGRLRGVRERRPRRDRAATRSSGRARAPSGSGGDPADEHGPRRHRGRLRPRADAGGRGRGRHPGDRLGRRRAARAPQRGDRARAARTRCCARRSSTTGPTRVREAKEHLRAAGHPGAVVAGEVTTGECCPHTSRILEIVSSRSSRTGSSPMIRLRLPVSGRAPARCLGIRSPTSCSSG